LDCSHLSKTAVTAAKFAGGQIKEEQAKLPEVHVKVVEWTADGVENWFQGNNNGTEIYWQNKSGSVAIKLTG